MTYLQEKGKLPVRKFFVIEDICLSRMRTICAPQAGEIEWVPCVDTTGWWPSRSRVLKSPCVRDWLEKTGTAHLPGWALPHRRCHTTHDENSSTHHHDSYKSEEQIHQNYVGFPCIPKFLRRLFNSHGPTWTYSMYMSGRPAPWESCRSLIRTAQRIYTVCPGRWAISTCCTYHLKMMWNQVKAI